MNILILHRIPYYKIDYHRGINHHKHEVFYIGTQASLDNIPKELRCKKIIRKDNGPVDVEVLEALKMLDVRFDHIISLSEYELVAAAKVRHALSVKGASIEEVELVRNKVKMKSFVKKAGLRIPDFMPLDKLIFNKGNEQRWYGKTILKPIDGASSENVKLFNSLADIKIKTLHHKTGIKVLDNPAADLSQFEVEEFIEGKIFHIDGLVHQGRIISCQASCYVGNCLRYALGEPLGSIQINTTAAIKEWSQQCLEAVSLREGSFHLEAIENGDELVFLEIANRVGGADVVKTFELATGIHMPSVELSCLIGEPLSIDTKKIIREKFGWFVFPGHHISSDYGKMLHTEKFKNHPYIQEWYELKNEQKLPRKITYQAIEVPIAGVIKGDNTKQLYDFLYSMFKMIEVVPNNPTPKAA